MPVRLDRAWEFFSDPSNLQHITPPRMGFTVVSEPHQGRIYAGQIIEYRLKPLLGIPMYWMTEITRVEPGKMFIDEQRFGPYSFWHHQHHFEPRGESTLMTDIVHYRIPLGWLSLYFCFGWAASPTACSLAANSACFSISAPPP
ncbi:SRPBCC family protein [uncultured Chitinophaga sp.]|uniref:SRPBCC family protein n=1 Tax=uncultured Chitinophaga sp. TaxID=339340 RepID=UPI00260B4DD0|nr:SRPBCC family protein [uncultured Chitinophaga sp.]